jgi:uncharacterized protein (TIGR03067 family)
MTYHLSPAKTPKSIDFTPTAGPDKGKPLPGIYELDGDDLKICFGKVGGPRPSGFTTAAGSGHVLVVLKRDRP